MAKRPQAEKRSLAGRFDKLCLIAYELGLLLAVATLALVAIHQVFTHHESIDETSDSSHVVATAEHPDQFRIGSTYPVYRFNSDWEDPIGHVAVERVDGNKVAFRLDPKEFRWPIGRQGRILNVDDKRIRVNMGSNLGFKVGDHLNVFSDRQPIATVQIMAVGQEESVAALYSATDPNMRSEKLNGDIVSEFPIADQVVIPYSEAVNGVDALIVLALLGIYLWLWIRFRASPFATLGPIVAAHIRIPTYVKLAFHAVLGVPAVWFLTEFAIRSICYLVFIVCSQIVHATIPTFLTFTTLQIVIGPLFGVILIGYLYVLMTHRISPFAVLVRHIAFKGGINKHTAQDLPEHITMWFFQAIIVYAFGRTLGGFFQENLNVGIGASWPHAPAVIVPMTAPVSFEGLARSIQSVSYALTHLPSPANQDALFLTIQTAIYNACILGCLLGYGYSLLGYLWGKRIRNVDFTIVGWLTNAVCYGPLFGVVLWQMLPPTAGADPTIVSGSLRTTTFIVEVFLNVVYTLSIWNLGTLFGVMTDKGVRTTGFYSVVRHPNYTMESLMFIMLFSRGLSTYHQWLAVGAFLLVYWLRSEREDQFMSHSNPDYLTYKERIQYKFIRGVY